MFGAGPSNTRDPDEAEEIRRSDAANQTAEGSHCTMRGESSISRKKRKVAGLKNVHDTASLVRCYNQAADEAEKEVLMEWFQKYLAHFDGLGRLLKRCHWEEFLKLGNIDYCGKTEAERKFYFLWLDSILKRIKPTCPEAIESLELALRMVPHGVFADNFRPLTDMMNRLLEMFEPRSEVLVKQNFQALRPMLLSLHQVFVLMQKAASRFLDKNQLLYQTVMNRLKEIKIKQRYYPIYYLTCLIEQGLCRIKNGKVAITMTGALRRDLSGVKAVLNASSVVSKAAKLEFDLDSFNPATKEAKSAVESNRMLKRDWYDEIRLLNSFAIECVLNPDSFERFYREADRLLDLHLLSRVQTKSSKAVQYSVIGEFQFLLAESESSEIRNRSLKWLLDKAKDSGTSGLGDDTDIFEALLDALSQAYSSADDSQKEKIEASIETMTDTAKKELRDCYSAWLGGLSLRERLGSVLQSNEPSESDLLFEEVKKEMPVLLTKEIDEIKEELKEYYRSRDFVEVPAFYDDGDKRHAKDLEFSLARFEKVRSKERKKKTRRKVGIVKEKSRLCLLVDKEDRRLRPSMDQSVVARPLEIKELFARSLTKTYPFRRIRKVLLFGHPGTGKTSVTKKIAYLWSVGEWGKEFDYVFVVPVRDLGAEYYDNLHITKKPNLATAITNICFDYKDEKHFVSLRNHIRDALCCNSTLVIIDGLDERSGACQEIIEEAKRIPCRLLLSGRPFGLDDERKLVDYEAECLGMDEDQLLRFIRREVKDGSADDLVSYLKTEERIWKWMQVPITANIICFVWKEDKRGKTTEQTFRCITSLYSKLVMYVWKTCASGRNIRVNKQEIFQSLGRIAFEAFAADQILIHPETVNSNSSNVLKRMAQDCGFLLLKLEGKLYRFPHLTFQEYFAGLHLAWCIEQGEPRDRSVAVRFVQEKKYDPRFEVVLRFTVENLANSGRTTMDDLITIVDGGPRDVMKWNHSCRKLWIVDGWISGRRRDTDKQSVSEKGIADKVRQILEKTKGNSRLFFLIFDQIKNCRQAISRQPEIQRLLSSGFQQSLSLYRSPDIRRGAAERAVEMAKAAPATLRDVGDSLFDLVYYYDDDVIQEAAEQVYRLAKAFPSTCQSTTEILLTRIDDEETSIDHTAIELVENLLQLVTVMSPRIAETLLKLMSHEVSQFRFMAAKHAVDVVKAFPEMSRSVAQRLLELMVDNEDNVRQAAAEETVKMAKAVPKMSKDLYQNLVSLMSYMNSDVRRAATKETVKMAKAFPAMTQDLYKKWLKLMGDEDIDVRREAAEGAMEMANASVKMSQRLATRLLELMNNEDTEVRRDAADWAEEIAKAVPAVSQRLAARSLELMDNEDSDVRQDATSWAVKIANAVPKKSQSIYEKLLELMRDEDSDVRSDAAEEAMKMAKASVKMFQRLTERLFELMDDEDSDVRQDAAEAAVEMAGIFPETSQSIYEKLLELMRDEDSDVRWVAAEGAVEIAKAVPAVSQSLHERFLELMRDKDSDVRLDAAEGAVEMAIAFPETSQSLAERLLELIGDEVSDVRQDAVEGAIEMAQAFPAVSQSLYERLLELMKDRDIDVRLDAVEGAVETARVFPAMSQSLAEKLLELAGEEDSDVRWIAAEGAVEMSKATLDVSQSLVERVLEMMRTRDDFDCLEAIREAVEVAKAVPAMRQGLTERLFEMMGNIDSDVCWAAAKGTVEMAKALPEISQSVAKKLFDEIVAERFIFRDAAVAYLREVRNLSIGALKDLAIGIMLSTDPEDVLSESSVASVIPYFPVECLLSLASTRDPLPKKFCAYVFLKRRTVYEKNSLTHFDVIGVDEGDRYDQFVGSPDSLYGLTLKINDLLINSMNKSLKEISRVISFTGKF